MTDMASLTRDENRELLTYLESFLTEERKQRFRNVIPFRTRHLTVALEDIYQEHNAGAIMRTCDCFGVQDVHVIEERYHSKITHNIAQGAEKWLTTYTYPPSEDESKNCIRQLKKSGYRIVATTPHAHESSLRDFDLATPAALFFGAEKTGISDALREEADELLCIPIYGFTESFNVSVATALILQSLTDRLHQREDITWQLSEEEQERILLKWTMQTVRSGEELAVRFLTERGIA